MFYHLRDTILNDNDIKKEFSVHIIIGTGDYTKITTQERARIGLLGQSIGKLIKRGWVVISSKPRK